MGLLNVVMLLNPAIAITAALLALGVAVAVFYDSTRRGADDFAAQWDKILADIIEGRLQSVQQELSNTENAFSSFTDSSITELNKWKQAQTDAVDAVADAIVSGIDQQIAALDSMFTNVKQTSIELDRFSKASIDAADNVAEALQFEADEFSRVWNIKRDIWSQEIRLREDMERRAAEFAQNELDRLQGVINANTSVADSLRVLGFSQDELRSIMSDLNLEYDMQLDSLETLAKSLTVAGVEGNIFAHVLELAKNKVAELGIEIKGLDELLIGFSGVIQDPNIGITGIEIIERTGLAAVIEELRAAEAALAEAQSQVSDDPATGAQPNLLARIASLLAEIARLEAIINGSTSASGSKASIPGAVLASIPTGGDPLGGVQQGGQVTVIENLNLNVEGSVVAEDLPTVIQGGLNEIAERGGGEFSNAGDRVVS